MKEVTEENAACFPAVHHPQEASRQKENLLTAAAMIIPWLLQNQQPKAAILPHTPQFFLKSPLCKRKLLGVLTPMSPGNRESGAEGL